jgi:hypothetical protein
MTAAVLVLMWASGEEWALQPEAGSRALTEAWVLAMRTAVCR